MNVCSQRQAMLRMRLRAQGLKQQRVLRPTVRWSIEKCLSVLYYWFLIHFIGSFLSLSSLLFFYL